VAYEFKLPDLGEGLTEGEIARWLVEEGQEIAEDDPLVEIATDKTTVEIPSPAGGKVSRILVGEGEVVPVGTVLVVIGGDGAAPEPRDDEPPRAEPACARSRSSSASTSPRSPAPGRRVGSPKRTSAARREAALPQPPPRASTSSSAA
jgi:pyruvate/2-oxoglutarate dehydrogenase complex dihydrolipoamide acyltransferase (E2) component